MGYLAILSLKNGKKAGLYAIFGIGLGLLIIGILASLGVAALISESPVIYQALRWAGVLYLLWLAWLGWHEETEAAPNGTTHIKENFKFFRRGLVTNLLNPKAAVFYIAMLPTFINTSHSIPMQTIGLTLIFVFVATSIHTAVVLLADSARIFLSNSHRLLITRRVLSFMLVLIALWFAYSTQKH